jgi:hypothetical protein
MAQRPRQARSDGLRELLIADREYGLPGCPKPGPWAAPRGGRDQLLEELKSGGPVEVDSSTLMCALMHARLDYRRYALGGADEGKVFRLTERDELVELPDG